MKKTVWFIILAIIAISCLNEPDCYQLNNSDAGIAFNVLGFSGDKDTLVHLYVTGTDSIFYDREYSANFELPLNPNANEISYAFKWADGQQDTLVLGYSSQVQFVSADCGQRYVFGGIVPLYSTFDSIRVVNPRPSAPSSTNLVVYRCAHPDDAGVKFRTKSSGSSVDSTLAVAEVVPDFAGPIYQSKTTSTFYLPLNRKKSSTSFTFLLESGGSEILTLSYNHETRVSAIDDCDSVTFFSKIRIASTTFDTTSTTFHNNSKTTVKATNTEDPAIINFEIFL